MVTRTDIDVMVETVRARHMEDTSLVALMDSLVTAAGTADALTSQMEVPEPGQYRSVQNAMTRLLQVAASQAQVEALYGAGRVALERLAAAA